MDEGQLSVALMPLAKHWMVQDVWLNNIEPRLHVCFIERHGVSPYRVSVIVGCTRLELQSLGIRGQKGMQQRDVVAAAFICVIPFPARLHFCQPQTRVVVRTIRPHHMLRVRLVMMKWNNNPKPPRGWSKYPWHCRGSNTSRNIFKVLIDITDTCIYQFRYLLSAAGLPSAPWPEP